MNSITIAGHLGADPEVRFTPSGNKVTTLRVACNSRRSGKEETIWWKVTLWGDSFDKLIPHFKKGSPIVVMGEMSKPEMFTDREGKSQISLNIVAYNISFSPFGRSEKKSDSSYGNHSGAMQQNSYGSQGQAENSYSPQQGQAPMESFSEEEIPF